MLDAFIQTATVSNVISASFGAVIIGNYDDEDDSLYPFVSRSASKKVHHWKHEEEIEPNKKRKKFIKNITKVQMHR